MTTFCYEVHDKIYVWYVVCDKFYVAAVPSSFAPFTKHLTCSDEAEKSYIFIDEREEEEKDGKDTSCIRLPKVNIPAECGDGLSTSIFVELRKSNAQAFLALHKIWSEQTFFSRLSKIFWCLKRK